jgi:hypothetical protein
MAVASEYGQLYFYNTDSNYLNKNIPAAGYYIGFDSKSRFVVVPWTQIFL